MNQQPPPPNPPPQPGANANPNAGCAKALTAVGTAALLPGLALVGFGVYLMATLEGDSTGVTPGPWFGGLVAFFGLAISLPGLLIIMAGHMSKQSADRIEPPESANWP